MGLFSVLRITSVYENRIRCFGFDPRDFPPDLHSTICSSFERRAERYADFSKLTGHARRDFIEVSVEEAANLLILCCIGSKSYDQKRIEPAAYEQIEELAKTWLKDGPEGSIELCLVHAVNRAGLLRAESSTKCNTDLLN